MGRDRYESSALDYSLESDPLTNNLYAFAGGNPVGNIEWDGHYYTGSDCHDNGLPGPSEFDRHCKGKKHHASGGGDGCGGRPCVLAPAPTAGNSESFKNSAVLKRAAEQAVMQRQLAAQNAAFAASMNADYALQQKIGRAMAPLGVIAMALAPHPAECGAGGDFKAGGCGMEVLNLFLPAKITSAGKVIKAVDDARDVGCGAKTRRATTLSQEVERLAESHITDSGTTVLGHFPGYIEKAQSRGASYFDIGAKWGQLSPAERTAANEHFLDRITATGDRVLLSTAKPWIKPGTALDHEVIYLTKEKGYRWVNQWSLRPPG